MTAEIFQAVLQVVPTVKKSNDSMVVGTDCGRVRLKAVFFLVGTLRKNVVPFKKIGATASSWHTVKNHWATTASVSANISIAVNAPRTWWTYSVSILRRGDL